MADYVIRIREAGTASAVPLPYGSSEYKLRAQLSSRFKSLQNKFGERLGLKEDLRLENKWVHHAPNKPSSRDVSKGAQSKMSHQRGVSGISRKEKS